MPYQEKHFASDFSLWLKTKQLLKFSFAVEFKLKPYPKRLNFKSDFQPQQIPALLKTKHQCIYKKLSDMDPSLKPFDALQICNSKSFVAILFYKPRSPKTFQMIDIDQLQLFATTHKSLNQDEAKLICDYEFTL